MTDTTPVQELYEAIAAGAADEARLLTRRHPELVQEYIAGDTWLHVAASYSNVDIVAMFVQLGIDVNAGRESDPATPLYFAASEGSLDVARWLIDRGADVQVRGHGTPLVSAVNGDHPEMVRLLVDAGAELNKCVGDDEPRSPLAWAEFYGHDDIAEFLRERGAVSLAPEDDELEDEILDHLEANLGEVEPLALRQIVPSTVPVAIQVVRGDDRTTLVTRGMSDQPMTVPEGGEEYQYAELMIHLPKRWPLSKKSLAKEKNFWPIEWLLRVSQYPHDNETWLGGMSAVIANGEPPEPLGENTEFTCVLLLTSDSELGQLTCSDGRQIVFYTLFPLYTEERDFERDHGTVELLQRFQQRGVSDVLELGRENVAI